MFIVNEYELQYKFFFLNSMTVSSVDRWSVLIGENSHSVPFCSCGINYCIDCKEVWLSLTRDSSLHVTSTVGMLGLSYCYIALLSGSNLMNVLTAQ